MSAVLLTNTSEIAAALGDAAASELDRAIDAVVRREYAQAVAGWPVDTGRSRASFRLEVTKTGGAVRWRIQNTQPYSAVIFQRELRPALSYVRLITLPMRVGIDAAVPEIAAAIGNKAVS